MRAVALALALLTVFDIVIHVATDQVEPLRIAGNIMVLATAVGVLVIQRMRRVWVALTAGGWNLVLNVIHVTLNGIGVLGVILIATTTVLCIVLAVQFARVPRRLV